MSAPRILLLEDDRWLADSYVRSLGDAYTVTVATSNQAALDMIDDGSYDLLVADVMLEQGLVIDLLHELRSHSDTLRLPVILCTGLASMIQPADVVAYGVVAVLDKSTVTPASLRVALQRALAEKGRDADHSD